VIPYKKEAGTPAVKASHEDTARQTTSVRRVTSSTRIGGLRVFCMEADDLTEARARNGWPQQIPGYYSLITSSKASKPSPSPGTLKWYGYLSSSGSYHHTTLRAPCLTSPICRIWVGSARGPASWSGRSAADALLAKWKGEWKGPFVPLLRKHAY
jgi:hypothetical protein